MSIITTAMQQNRDVNSADKCLFWMPCNEGSGTTVADDIGSVSVTDASAVHTTANAITFGYAAAQPAAGTMPVLKENFVLVVSGKVATTESFFSLKLGSTVFCSVNSGVASCDYGVGTGNGATTASSAIGSADTNIVTMACAVIGDTIYHYASVNGAGISENNTADASGFTAAFSAGTPTLSNSFTISSIAVRQHIYGAAYSGFDKGDLTTTQVIAALNEIDANWPVGRKYLPEVLK